MNEDVAKYYKDDPTVALPERPLRNLLALIDEITSEICGPEGVSNNAPSPDRVCELCMAWAEIRDLLPDTTSSGDRW